MWHYVCIGLKIAAAPLKACCHQSIFFMFVHPGVEVSQNVFNLAQHRLDAWGNS